MRAGRRAKSAAALAGLLLALVASERPASAQAGWTIDVAADRSGVTLGGVDSVWSSIGIQVGWADPERGGWFGGVQRHDRFNRSDVVFSTNGYRRLGDWTVAGGVAGTPDADFWFRRSLEGEVSRRLVGTVVVSGGFRAMTFAAVSVRQVQPAVTWYHRRGEVQARVFFTKQSARDRHSATALVQASTRVTSRLWVSFAAARGDRIFDIGSIAAGSAKAWMARGGLRIGIGRHASIEIAGGYAREDPGFELRTMAVSLRRTF